MWIVCNVEMSFHFRLRLLGILEVGLRVPPLFVIDEILRAGLGINDLSEHDLSNFDNGKLLNNSPQVVLDGAPFNASTTPDSPSTTTYEDLLIYKFVFISLLRLTLSFLGCTVGICLFMLSTKHLMVVYLYLCSVAVVFISYWTNVGVVKSLSASSATMHTDVADNDLSITLLQYILNDFDKFLNNHNQATQLIRNLLIQTLLGLIYVNIHLGPRFVFLQRVLPICFVAPTILAMLPFPDAIIYNGPVIAALLPLSLVSFVLWSSIISIVQSIYMGYVNARTFVSNFGMSALVETNWLRLNVPEVLRTFWFLRAVENATIFFLSGMWDENDGNSPYFRLMKYVMVTGCETLTAVLGITSIVSYICNYIGKFFQWILLTDESDKNFGTVSAIVFYILALQTGLTSLEPDIRFVRLCRNFCLLFTALLHFTHNVVNPLLMSLSASHNPSKRKHVRALSVCAVLVILPVLLMYYLWSTQETSTWLLAVTAFSIEVIVKVFVSLTIYSLFLLDARRETFWEKLDDYIYYTRSFGNTVEFCFGIFLFFNGAWILIFESGSAIRALMMCIHAYFNIWCDAKAGWVVFMKRRTAVNKIESLPEADREQLRQFDDVCAICYQEMQSAKITKCKHFFHGVCLRKWLYVQDRCPLCHEILHAVESGEDKGGSGRRAEPLPDGSNLQREVPAVEAVAEAPPDDYFR